MLLEFLVCLPSLHLHTSNDQKSAKFLAQIGLACLQIGNKSPCLFAYHPQISLPICVSSQISLPICVSSTNLPAYLRIFLPICAKNFACFYSFDQCCKLQKLTISLVHTKNSVRIGFLLLTTNFLKN